MSSKAPNSKLCLFFFQPTFTFISPLLQEHKLVTAKFEALMRPVVITANSWAGRLTLLHALCSRGTGTRRYKKQIYYKHSEAIQHRLAATLLSLWLNMSLTTSLHLWCEWIMGTMWSTLGHWKTLDYKSSSLLEHVFFFFFVQKVKVTGLFRDWNGKWQ